MDQSNNHASITMARDSELKVKWSEISTGVAETLANFLLKGFADGGVSALVSAVKTLGAIRINEPVEARAWRIAALSFAWATGRIYDDVGGLQEGVKSLLHQALQQAKCSIDTGEECLPTTFLERPTTLPLYRTMKRILIEGRDHFLPNSALKDASIEAKLDVAFRRGVFTVWARQPDYFQPIADAVTAPGFQAVESDLSWNAYRQSLVYYFEVNPVFGQDKSRVSLKQIYVPLRAYWKSSDDNSRFYRGVARVPQSANFVMLDDVLNDWLSDDNASDSIRLIGGGPGSGKSTTLRALASRLAKRVDLRPLFIPLQHIGISGDFREAINRHFTEGSDNPFHQPPLSRASVEDGPPLVLIFDGLDELVAPNEAANEVIATFSARLTALTAALRGDGLRNIKVVVSGRLPAFQFAKRFISPPPEGSLEVYGFTPVIRHEPEEGNSLWDIDQRPDWWLKYATAVNQEPATPPAFSAKQLESITHEPLLCYLLVLAGYAVGDWESAANNQNLIYSTLMRSIYERGWGEGEQKRHGPGKSMTLEEFLLLMETIGLAAWLGGDARIASDASFNNALKITRAELAWSRFNADNGTDVTNLAMNFYLKSAEGSHRGFEFTHKSFGEYLAAKALLRTAAAMYDLVARRIDLAMSEWFDATRTGILTVEILTFMRNEVRLLFSQPNYNAHLHSEIKTAFQLMAESSIVNGFPTSSTPDFRTLDQYQINAEHACWGIINSYALGFARKDDFERAVVNINWHGRYELRQLLVRQSGPGGFSTSFPMCMSYINAKDQFVYALPVYEGDFVGAFLGEASFNGCTLVNCSFAGSDLSRTSFDRSYLINSMFAFSIVNLTGFTGCTIRECNFDEVSGPSVVVNLTTLIMSDGPFQQAFESRMFGPLDGDYQEEEHVAPEHVRRALKTVNTLPRLAPDAYARSREEAAKIGAT